MEQKEFINRIVQLRLSKGVSARDMSLSLGQSAGYINNIENGVNYPSMSIFFYICDFFDITPKQFFDTESIDPLKERELISVAQGLTKEQLDSLIAFLKSINKNRE